RFSAEQFGQTVRDDTIQLVVGGARTGDNKSTAASWSTSEEIVSFGGTTDVWGLSLTPADVNASDFGVALRLVQSLSMQASVDAVELRVVYEVSTLHASRTLDLRWDSIGRVSSAL